MQVGLMQTWRWRDFYRALMLDVRAAKEIRLFGLAEFLLQRMTEAVARGTRIELRLERLGLAVDGVLSAATALVTAAGAWIAVDGAVSGQLQVGDVMLFLAAVAGIQGAAAGLVLQAGMAGRVLLMFEHYLAVVDLPAPPQGRIEVLAQLRDRIELRDVWFRYDPDGPWVLQGVDLTIRRGRSLGLVGLNGAGKSTLVKLLCGLYQAERGEILWDGVDLRDVALGALRARMAAVFQDFMTYDLSAAENVGLGDVARLQDEAAIHRAAALAGIHEALAGLPSGYRTSLSRVMPDEEDEDAVGVSLSGGQWQRVAIARSLMRRDVDLMILDEPSSGLDAASEAEIHRMLRDRTSGRACLLVSHRLNGLRGADAIVVLADGRVAERGTHDELMARGGEYCRLFSLQAEGYQLDVAGAA